MYLVQNEKKIHENFRPKQTQAILSKTILDRLYFPHFLTNLCQNYRIRNIIRPY